MNETLSAEALDLLRRRLAKGQSSSESSPLPVLRSDEASRFEPFPLNDMQQAYWIGRQGDDQTGMHCFMERRTERFDFDRLCRAWDRLVARHDMLRVVITEEGKQRILPYQPGTGLPERHDQRSLSRREQQQRLSMLRDELAHYKADLSQWPQHRIHWCDTGNGIGYLMISLDIWCIDGQSIQTLINELACLYGDPDCALPALGMTFRDYVLACMEFEQGPVHARALNYWRERIGRLPSAPSLPLTVGAGVPNPPRFERCEISLTAEQTRAIRKLVADHGLTLTTLLAACYAEVLTRWSGSRHFLLNMPRFNRKPIHPDIHSVLGEFATFTLLEVMLDGEKRFGERIAAMQQQLWLDMENDAVSGVRVLRELNQLSGGRSHAPAPIVFTSLPETVSGTDNLHAATVALGEPTYSLSQTPQVWLDCQYYQEAGCLRLNWDYLVGRFPTGMIDAMFGVFADIVRRLASPTGAQILQQDQIVQLPEEQRARRAEANRTARSWPEMPLAWYLARAAQRWPQNVALRVDEQVLTYQELVGRANALAQVLRSEPGRIAIRLGKSVEQIVATLACLLAGRSYVPLDIEQPQERQHEIARIAQVVWVLTHDELPTWEGTGEALACSRWPTSLLKIEGIELEWSPEAEIYVLFTSGSTGQPKGVPIQQRGLINLLEHNVHWLGLTPEDRVFGVSALHHDMSVVELLGSLFLGAALVMPGEAHRRDPAQWIKLMLKHRVSYWNSVPAFAEMLIEHAEHTGASVGSLRQVTLGGDWLPVDIGYRLARIAPGVTVHSTGGPTEITVWNITHTLRPEDTDRASIPYGKPISNSRYYIVNDDGEECPDWVCGEMVCAGDGLSPGYLCSGAGSTRAFGPLADLERHSYHTGDLGRYLPDGSIEFIGRRDSQVKLNGYRIELGEIESVLQRHSFVERAIVELRKEPHPQLVAWVESDLGENVLRSYAIQALPANMVPAIWQRCDHWPLNANGKVDRRALSARSLVDSANADIAMDLQGPLEHWLAECWSTLLGRHAASRQANFFHLGGDSLLAVRMLGAIEARTGIRLAAQQIFATPTLDQLAAKIREELTAQGRSDVDWERGQLRELPVRGEPAAPLSWSQRGLWLIEQQESDSTAYALPLFLSLEGPLDAESLGKAVDAVLADHEILRYRFGFDPEKLHPYQLSDAQPPRLAHVRLADGLTLRDWMADFVHQGFDLENGISTRAVLVDAGPEGWLLALYFHHIVFDGWSSGVLLQQVADAYAALRRGQPVPCGNWSFGNYAAWEQAQEEDSVARRFWQDELSDLPVLNLTTDRPRPARQNYRGASVNLRFTQEQVARLERLASQHDATLFMVLLSVYQLLLGRYSQQEDVVVGTYVAGRDHPATHEMLGCFVNNVLMRTQWHPEQPFGEFFAQNKDRIVAALKHQHYPFEKLVAMDGVPRDNSRHPLYQAGFAMQPRHAWPELEGGVSLRQRSPPLHTSHMDMDLYVIPDAGYLWLELNYASSLFDPARMQRFLEHYARLLEAVVAQPGTPLLDLHYWSGQGGVPAVKHVPAQIDLPERLLAALRRGGDRCALIDQGGHTSFAQLLERSQRMASGLREQGAGPDVVVGVYLPRSAEQIGLMLAIIFTGAIYLPLDADYPVARIAAILSQAQPALLLSDDTHCAKLPSPYDRQARPWQALLGATPSSPICSYPSPEQAMYLLFTSGSTGTPKGIIGTWATAQNRTDWLAQTYLLTERDCCAIRTPLNFVDSLWEILDPLLATCRCVVVSTDTVVDSRRLLPLMTQHAVSRMVVVPSLIRSWLRDGVDLLGSWQSLDILLSSAEAADVEDVKALYRMLPALRFVNCYGSSEVADVTVYQWPRQPTREDQVVLGKPLPGCRIYLLDKWGHVVAPGNSGHIHVAGHHLPVGYLDGVGNAIAPVRLTVQEPLFAMGDWGHWRADGELVFQGRFDDLVKIRGNRVELAEVNQHVRAANGEGDAIVLAVADPQGGRQLVAWIESGDGARTKIVARVRQALMAQLPNYMVPTRYEVLPQLPMLPNGKIDRACLLNGLGVSVNQPTYVLDARERQLAELIASLVGHETPNLDPQCGLYELGLNSLSLASLHAKLQFCYPASEITLAELFQYSTLSQLARRLTGSVSEQEDQALPAPTARQRLRKRLNDPSIEGNER
ncbi:amino acid adenylation domain-containing protein [Verminephrobacter aporrectodeae subsp. tuberculatae]|uniref:non-ribosomal peptide synthetase n=2 Tax=Verminephrobacter aporrectodeae TaxID=1110389 RepID=UPI0022371AFB|nr:non-ribosomal peptide synthetase [Verminephrobacter aporrectodeae]MCW5258052.1 amino acid adenylation domain-containing protein [Verminephrobacter aporrectodeae subsp. tuberculatae]